METAVGAVAGGGEPPADDQPAKTGRWWMPIAVTVAILAASWVAVWVVFAVLSPTGAADVWETAFEDPSNRLGLLSYAAMAVTTVLLVIAFTRPKSVVRLGLGGVDRDTLWLACVAGVGIHFLADYVVHLMQASAGEYPQTHPLSRWAAGQETLIDVLAIALIYAVGAAVSEELLFRGYLMRGLLKHWHPIAAIGLSAFLFGLVHLSPAHALAVMPLGVWMGYVAWRTGSTTNTIIVHLATIVTIVCTAWFSATVESQWLATGAVVALWIAGVWCCVLLVKRWETSAAVHQSPPR
jgi:uncharacterized protein